MKKLNSIELLTRTKTLIAQERKITLALIEHLEEISRRMLYAELGYSSLWDFATRELGLSEGAAQRRIQAMRLVRDVPEAKTALNSGKLSLSNAAKVQSFRQAEKKRGRRPDPKKLVAQVESLSQRECEKALFAMSPAALPREHERIISAQEHRVLKLVISAGFHKKIQRLKGLLAHTFPDASTSELLEHVATEMLVQLEKKKGIIPPSPEQPIPTAAGAAVSRPTLPDVAMTSHPVPGDSMSETIPDLSNATRPNAIRPRKVDSSLPAGRRVYLPVALRKRVWAKSGGRCEISVQGERCRSRHRLEIDHITPLARGGSNEASNLRLICWQHNQQQALRWLGKRFYPGSGAALNTRRFEPALNTRRVDSALNTRRFEPAPNTRRVNSALNRDRVDCGTVSR